MRTFIAILAAAFIGLAFTPTTASARMGGFHGGGFHGGGASNTKPGTLHRRQLELRSYCTIAASRRSAAVRSESMIWS